MQGVFYHHEFPVRLNSEDKYALSQGRSVQGFLPPQKNYRSYKNFGGPPPYYASPLGGVSALGKGSFASGNNMYNTPMGLPPPGFVRTAS